MTLDGWTLRAKGDITVAVFVADEAVEAGLTDDGLHLYVSDGTRYYPSGEYSIPFTVIDELRRLNA